VLVKQPLYQQLNEALRSLLSSGEFKTGARFLTEREVSQRFEISRATANKALSNLVSEGILEFKKGVGTFVRGGVLDYDLRSLVSFTGKASGAGKKPSTRVLNFDRVPGAKHDPSLLRWGLHQTIRQQGRPTFRVAHGHAIKGATTTLEHRRCSTRKQGLATPPAVNAARGPRTRRHRPRA